MGNKIETIIVGIMIFIAATAMLILPLVAY